MTKIDPATTALVLVDLQRRIIALPTTPHPGSAVLANAIRLRDAFRAAGAPIVLVQAHRPNVEQPEGSELDPALTPAEGEELVTKHTIGGFYGTGLDAHLRALGVRTVVFGGIATEMGVESTLRAAADHGYETVAAADAMTGMSALAHESALTVVFPRFGEVLSTEEIVAALG
ncbi:isochorismatase family protein [Crossiella sp. CA-258035]|uniref:isochorismatase family protein n=1 Tax=Crossiella sp. CA-258035 TaxID=2981138 RepID=UPI0024BBEBCA|nr:isochorismatase family protein [Crossiella sp. CA-258035]WHT16524.1 isochorismatase family protein [Crossiella sp. CA-258035]